MSSAQSATKNSLRAISIPKSCKEVNSASLQNPSDPDASYDSHKGQGYQIQVMETYCARRSSGEEKTLNLITHVQLEKPASMTPMPLFPPLGCYFARLVHPNNFWPISLYGSDDNNRRHMPSQQYF